MKKGDMSIETFIRITLIVAALFILGLTIIYMTRESADNILQLFK